MQSSSLNLLFTAPRTQEDIMLIVQLEPIFGKFGELTSQQLSLLMNKLSSYYTEVLPSPSQCALLLRALVDFLKHLS